MRYVKHIIIFAVLASVLCFAAGCAFGEKDEQIPAPPSGAAPYRDRSEDETLLYFPFAEESGRVVFAASP